MAKANKKYKKLNSHSVEKMKKLAKKPHGKSKEPPTNGASHNQDNDAASNVKLDLDVFVREEEKTLQMENDTNMLVIEASGKKKHKKNESDDETNKVESKKKRLTRKERVKLEKVLERKEKTSRVRI